MSEIKGSASFPFRNAVLCDDCNRVSAAIHHCPDCGSAVLLNLARVVEGKPKTQQRPVQGPQLVSNRVLSRWLIKRHASFSNAMRSEEERANG